MLLRSSVVVVGICAKLRCFSEFASSFKIVPEFPMALFRLACAPSNVSETPCNFSGWSSCDVSCYAGHNRMVLAGHVVIHTALEHRTEKHMILHKTVAFTDTTIEILRF